MDLKKLISIYQWILDDKNSILEYNDSNKTNKFIIKFNVDENDLLNEESEKYIALVHDKNSNIYYVTFKGLVHLIKIENFEELKQNFFEHYYLQQNELIRNKSVVNEIELLYDELNPVESYKSVDFNIAEFGEQMSALVREQEYRDRQQRHDAMRARDHMQYVDNYPSQPIDYPSLFDTNNNSNSMERLRRLFPM